MSEALQDFAAAVQNLISTNRDAEQGFRAAADAVPDTTLKRMFVELSSQRAGFAAEIQKAVRDIGFEPPDPLGTAGTVRGVWIAFKGAVLANKAHAALVEAERAEDNSLATYRAGLAMVLQPELRADCRAAIRGDTAIARAHPDATGSDRAAAPGSRTGR